MLMCVCYQLFLSDASSSVLFTNVDTSFLITKIDFGGSKKRGTGAASSLTILGNLVDFDLLSLILLLLLLLSSSVKVNNSKKQQNATKKKFRK